MFVFFFSHFAQTYVVLRWQEKENYSFGRQFCFVFPKSNKKNNKTNKKKSPNCEGFIPEIDGDDVRRIIRDQFLSPAKISNPESEFHTLADFQLTDTQSDEMEMSTKQTFLTVFLSKIRKIMVDFLILEIFRNSRAVFDVIFESLKNFPQF